MNKTMNKTKQTSKPILGKLYKVYILDVDNIKHRIMLFKKIEKGYYSTVSFLDTDKIVIFLSKEKDVYKRWFYKVLVDGKIYYIKSIDIEHDICYFENIK